MTNALLACATAVLYCISAWQIAQRLLNTHHTGTIRRPLGVAAAASLLHLLLIVWASTINGHLTFQFAHAMSTIGWVLSALILLLSLREPVASLGVLVFPCVGTAALISGLLPPSPHSSQLSQGMALHVALSVIAYGILVVAAMQACVLAIQNNRLHAHTTGGFIRKLPPLASMESLLFRLIAVGFVTLSLALISGLNHLDNMFAQNLAHKTILSLLAWGIFGTLLIGRRLAGWRGRTAVRWTLAGSATLVVGYAGSKFVAEVLLVQ